MKQGFVSWRKIFVLLFVVVLLPLSVSPAVTNCNKTSSCCTASNHNQQQQTDWYTNSYHIRSSSQSSGGNLVFVGVLIAVGGQFFIASGAVLQKYTHEQIRKKIQQARRTSNNNTSTVMDNSAGLSVEGSNQNNEHKPSVSENHCTREKPREEVDGYDGNHSIELSLDSSPPFTTLKDQRKDELKSLQTLEPTGRAHSFDDWDKAKRREQMLDIRDDSGYEDYQEMSLDIAALSRLHGLSTDSVTGNSKEYNNAVEYNYTEEQNDRKGNDMVSRLRQVRKRLWEHSVPVQRPRNISVTSEPIRKKTFFTVSPPQSPRLNWEQVAARHGLHIPNSESFRQVERVLEEQHREDAGAVERTHYLKRKKWWTGLLLIGGGEACNLIAFGFAPGSTVAPLGVLVVPINALLAWKFLKEKVTWATLLGILLSVAGAVLVGVFGPSGPDSTGALNQSEILHLLDNVAFIVFISITVGVICAIFVINIITGIGVRYLLVYALMSGMSAAVSVTSAKGVVQLIRYSVTGKGDQLAKPLIYVMAFVLLVAILFMVYYMNRGMQTFRVTLFLSVYYGFFMTFSVVSSILMYQEYHYITAFNTPFFIGIGIIFVGISVISFSSRPQETEEEEAEFLEALRRYWATHGSQSSLSSREGRNSRQLSEQDSRNGVHMAVE